MKQKLLLFGALALTFSSQAQERVPLFEVFTSSTCPPCKPGNTIYEGVLAGKNPDEYVSVKFQQDFPGTGDPYSTNEAVTRRGYYAVSAIPNMQIDGGWNQNAQSFTQSVYDQYRAVPATAELAGNYSVSRDKVVTATVTYKALTGLTAATLYVAVVESRTVRNVRNNGETEFFNVVKKMLPGSFGTALGTLAANDTGSLTLTYMFPGAYRLPPNGQPASRINLNTEHSVEDSTHLRVVCWLQDAGKHVAQAANLKSVFPTSVTQLQSGPLSDCRVFPNPANTALGIQLNVATTGKVSALLVDMNGAVVARQHSLMMAGHNSLSFDTSSLPAGNYSLLVLDDNNNSFGQMVTVTH